MTVFPDKKPTLPRNPMANWDSRAWVRRPRHDDTQKEEPVLPLFPVKLVPAASHPLVAERGTTFIDALLAHRFFTYADFTSRLEREAVNVTTKDLARGSFWTDLTPEMREGAAQIYTDEGFHAQEAEETLRALVLERRIQPAYLQPPRFLTNLETACEDMGAAQRRLMYAGFTIVSETLISAILAEIPHDRSVDATVRNFVREHAQDEGRHHAYFSNILRLSWPYLAQRDRDFLAPHLASFVRWFLDPDHAWLRAFLADAGFDATTAQQVVEESYPPAEVDAHVRRAARHSLALFEEVGLFDSQIAVEAFAAAGLR